MTKRTRAEFCFICNHEHAFSLGEPCPICGHSSSSSSECSAVRRPAFPTEIVPQVYLGAYDHATRLESLQAMGITFILNTVPSCQELYRSCFTHHTVSRCQHPKEVPLHECFDFIDRSTSKGGNVLVHCMTGTSRGASVVIGYLMHSRRWRLRQSYEWVVQRHPETKLQPQASKQLQQLESELFPHDSPQPSAPSEAFAPLSQELPQIGPFGTPLQKADDSGSSVPAEQPFPMFGSAHDNFSFGASPSSQQPKERSERAGDPRERMQS